MGIRLWIVVMILVLLLEEWGRLCHGCWEEERIALLQIKSAFNHPLSDDSDTVWGISGWGIDADCCTWNRVSCNKTTKRVTVLDLEFTMNQYSEGWYLNASLFLSFKDLNILYLSRNQILGCIKNEGFEKLSKLAHLEDINLSDNKFNKSILSSLRGLSSLKTLDLSYNRLKGIVDVQVLNNLTSLKTLYLAGNHIEGFKSLQGDDQEVLKLSNLEVIDLLANKLDTSILSSLKGLSSLKSLYLGYNQLKGLINMKELHSLSHLEELDLSGNEIEGFLAPEENKSWNNMSVLNLEEIRTNASHFLDLQSLSGSFPNLDTLYLGYNDLQGTLDGQGWPYLKSLKTLHLSFSSLDFSMLQTIGNLISLEFLSMPNCQLSGPIPIAEGLCNLNQLQILYINRNNLSGTLPPCMANLTSLRELDLSDNHFTGNLSLSPLKTLTSIEILKLSHNHFQIPLTLSPFFNHTKLFSFIADGNNIIAEAEENSLTPKFQLTELSLSGYGYCRTFPKFLYHQLNLQIVDLSHIQLSEGFPYWLLENNTDLLELNLVNNSLSGQLQLPSHSRMGLLYLDISENYLHGHVPAQIGTHFPNLESLNMSGNGFDGSIPHSLGNMSSMAFLDLSNNALSGEIPGELATGCLSLYMLLLSNNSLEGQIFTGNLNLQYLLSLHLDGNQFTGTIPNCLSNCSRLNILDLSHNNIHGRLPQWIGNMSALQVLDLSNNNISGSLPSNLPLSIKQVYLSKNSLQGSLENAFYNSSNLVMLDLGHNFFTGSIPKWIHIFSNLSYLLLDNNNFQGEIPIQLCKLDKISLIDFSHNYLSGHILHCLTETTWDRTHASESFWLSHPTVNDSALQPHVEFTTKSFSYSYEGRPLSYMSGIDLSCNNLTGEIPLEFGNLSTIKVLNLSHNSLTGSIPSTFSNLKEIESLDLSYNSLNGNIPPQLTQLYQLAVFTVAHNNLSGKIPEMVAQFATFNKSSYEGNPFLCGPPLLKCCNGLPLPSSSSKNSSKHGEETGLIDMDAFYPSFIASYSVVLLGMAAVLYINPHWRQAWFYFVELCINNCYYFLVDNLPMLSKFRTSHPCV